MILWFYLFKMIQFKRRQKLSFLDQSENFISVLMFTNNNSYNEIIPVCYKNRQNYAIFRTNLPLYNSSNESILFISNFPLRKNKQILKYTSVSSRQSLRSALGFAPVLRRLNFSSFRRDWLLSKLHIFCFVLIDPFVSYITN